MPLTSSSILKSTCFCGKASITIHGAPVHSHYCHCNMCQSLHGAPFGLIAVFRENQVTPPANLHEMFDSYEFLDRVMVYRCKVCGCPIFSWTKNYKSWGVYVGANIVVVDEDETPEGEKLRSRDDPKLEGVMHMFYGERQRDVNDGLPKWIGLPGATEQLLDH